MGLYFFETCFTGGGLPGGGEGLTGGSFLLICKTFHGVWVFLPIVLQIVSGQGGGAILDTPLYGRGFSLRGSPFWFFRNLPGGGH